MVLTDEHGSGNPELDALVSRLWATEGHSPVRAAWRHGRGGHPAPAGYVEVERYAVVPSVRRARFLVPLVSRRAAAASLLRYNGLRPPRTAAVRNALGAAFRVGGGRVFSDVLQVLVRADVPERDLPDHLLMARLRQALGAPTLAAGIGVRPLDPNAKPTLQLFDDRGEAVGYAKIGWSDATRRLVDTESQVLRGLTPAAGALWTPRVLADGDWAGRRFVVTSPLPGAIDRHRNPANPPAAAVLREVAGPLVRTPLTASAYWRGIETELAAMRESTSAPDLAEALSAYAAALSHRWGAQDLHFGRWHGDWVPWNLGWHAGRLHVWDWEHSSSDAPLGLDQAHWHFQVAFVLRGQPLPAALEAVRAACEIGWPELDISAAEGPSVADLYLLELALRTFRLHQGGGGWNAGLYPALLPALRARTTSGHITERAERTGATLRQLGESA